MPKDIAMVLAIKAFELHGKDDFTVSVGLDAAKPETLKAFQTFQEMLMMAYHEGRAAQTRLEVAGRKKFLAGLQVSA